MASPCLRIVRELPQLDGGAMLLAFTGWMDGGEVSTGTVRHLMTQLSSVEIASIDPEPFYIYNFPGSMEIAALFRPHVKYVQGKIEEFQLPSDAFFCDPARKLVFFIGKEPNLRWREFADCIFSLAAQAGLSRLCFVGSFGGAVPHTREPRLFGSVSHDRLKPILLQRGVRMTEYEGPAAFSTYLLAEAPRRNLDMISIAAEIPSYLQGENPLCIEAVTRRLMAILDFHVDLSPMRLASDEWIGEVTGLVQGDPKLAERIRELEEAYDAELLEDASGLQE